MEVTWNCSFHTFLIYLKLSMIVLTKSLFNWHGLSACLRTRIFPKYQQTIPQNTKKLGVCHFSPSLCLFFYQLFNILSLFLPSGFTFVFLDQTIPAAFDRYFPTMPQLIWKNPKQPTPNPNIYMLPHKQKARSRLNKVCCCILHKQTLPFAISAQVNFGQYLESRQQ